MGIIKNFMDVVLMNPDEDDEFDNELYDFDDDLEDDDDFEPAPKKSRKAKAEKPSKATKAASAEDDLDDFEPAPKKPERVVKPVKPSNKITPISKAQRRQTVEMEVCVIKPLNMDDELEIASTLLSGTTVVLNLEGMQVDIAQRIIDFTCGATYAMGGTLRKVSHFIFVATPNGVDISGDISDIMDSVDIGF